MRAHGTKGLPTQLSCAAREPWHVAEPVLLPLMLLPAAAMGKP